MKSEGTQEFLKSLSSKRKTLRLGRAFSLTYLDITSAERAKLYELARQRGLLTRYEFSGVESFGINRNDAARTVLQKTRERALEKLKIEFGAKASLLGESEAVVERRFLLEVSEAGGGY